jgi:adenosine deaminase
VGHGVRIVEDAGLAALARERGTAFEVCLTSNWQSGVIVQLADHPLRRMVTLDLLTTLNTDDPGVSGITLSDEYASALAPLGFSLVELKQLVLNAAGCALLPPAARAELVADFKQSLATGGALPQTAGS